MALANLSNGIIINRFGDSLRMRYGYFFVKNAWTLWNFNYSKQVILSYQLFEKLKVNLTLKSKNINVW